MKLNRRGMFSLMGGTGLLWLAGCGGGASTSTVPVTRATQERVGSVVRKLFSGGAMFGAGVVGGDWKDGSAVWGFVGMNTGIAVTGALSTVYTPSYNAQKWMWIGYAAGTAAGLLVYPFYLGSDASPRHGLIANALGGLAGVGLAAVFAGQTTDDEPTGKHATFSPPFQLGAAPAPGGGGTVTAYGTF